MSYIRPCNKCGQRISMREMRAGQWVAFDASTETPHRCGKKTKADPNIKKLAKEKIKEQDSEGIDLGYSDIEGDSLSAEQADEINSKIYEVYEEASNTPPKGEKKYKKEEVIIAKKETLKEKNLILRRVKKGLKTEIELNHLNLKNIIKPEIGLFK